jgi:GATA-binding protein, other eukaryote
MPGFGGISQLRKSVDHSNLSATDPMNLDDFILPSSVASPAGISTSDSSDNAGASANAVASAIPIKMRKESHASTPTNLPPASAPPPPHNQKRENEFDYVQKLVRKTSIDERKVCDRVLMGIHDLLR